MPHRMNFAFIALVDGRECGDSLLPYVLRGVVYFVRSLKWFRLVPTVMRLGVCAHYAQNQPDTANALTAAR